MGIGQVLEAPRPKRELGEVEVFGNRDQWEQRHWRAHPVGVFRVKFPGFDRLGDKIGAVDREPPENLFAGVNLSTRQRCV